MISEAINNNDNTKEFDERQKIIAMTLKAKVDIFKLKLKKKKLLQEIYRAYFEGYLLLIGFLLLLLLYYHYDYHYHHYENCYYYYHYCYHYY